MWPTNKQLNLTSSTKRSSYACIEQNWIIHNYLNTTSGLYMQLEQCYDMQVILPEHVHININVSKFQILSKLVYQNWYHLCHTGYIIIIIYTNQLLLTWHSQQQLYMYYHKIKSTYFMLVLCPHVLVLAICMRWLQTFFGPFSDTE